MSTREAQRENHRVRKDKHVKEEHARSLVEIQGHLQRVTALQEITLAVTSASGLRAIIGVLLSKMDLLAPRSIVFVWLIDKKTGRLNRFTGQSLGKGDREWKEMKIDEIPRLTRAVIESEGPVVVRNIQSDPRASTTSFLRRHGLVSYLGVPMSVRGMILGALCFMTKKEHRFTEEEIEDLIVVAQQAALAISNAQLFEQAEKQAGKLRELTRHLESVREIERARIAREIHDELGQTLTALKMDVAWLRSRSPEDQVPVQDRAQAMLKLIDTTMDTVRRISTTLRPAILDDFGLSAAMQWQADDFEKRSGIRCRVSLPAEEVELDPQRATGMFRIFQETLTNIMRHANATAVNISLRSETAGLALEVEDNGRGITDSEMYDAKSVGLLGMRERALLMGGEFNIRGMKGKGTKVKVRIPSNPGKK